ncbi:MAG: aminodeoxychorismate synthase component I [Lentisphaerota bacterium]
MKNAVAGRWLHFTRPRRIVTACCLEDVVPAIQTLEKAVNDDGLHAAGFISYEAAPAFDPALKTRVDAEFPLCWFGLFEGPEETGELPAGDDAGLWSAIWQPTISEDDYRHHLEAIRDFIRQGDTYQVNYTYRLRGQVCSDPWKIFLGMAAAQYAPYSAFVDTGEWAVCSASPELFLKWDGQSLESRPMKGTAARGLWSDDDRRKAAGLRVSRKNRAENVMIVDMVRNDLGRVAEIGSVTAPSLFAVEQYPSVWQMTSTVQARTTASLSQILQATFPPASITGAPKSRTMEIIADLETTPRRVYTGAVGYLSPGCRAQFNVAIRTLLIHRKNGEAEYGVGGGIVWDSKWASERQECRIKAKVLSMRRPDFDLLETLRWAPESGCDLLRYHLKRLAESAAYFQYTLDTSLVRLELDQLASRLPPAPHRVRLLASRKGAVRVEATPLPPGPSSFPDITLAQSPVDSSDVFLYHKTTHRDSYLEALKTRPGCSDALLFNQAGEITETTIANVVVELDGQLFTPPIRCGLLPGTFRSFLLDQNKIRERVVTKEEILQSPNIFLINSVRGMHRVGLVR